MTTASATFAYDHSSDAGFRVWGKGVSDLLVAAGAVLTADTGQINWTTVTRPGAGASAGYEMFKFTDTTGDWYLRVSYETAAVATYPALSFQIGASTNGAGVLDVNTVRSIGRWDRPVLSSATAVTSYACVYQGAMSLQFGQSTTAGGILTIERRRDRTTGALVSAFDFMAFGTSAGGAFGSANATRLLNVSWRANPAWVSTAGTYSMSSFVPFGQTSSGSAGDKNIYVWYGSFPAAHVAISGCTYIASEITADTTFSVVLPPGSGSRTYRATGMLGAANQLTTTYAMAVLWT